MSCVMTLGLPIEFISVTFSSELTYFALFHFINPIEVEWYAYLAINLLNRGH